jgi:hypothetical protein
MKFMMAIRPSVGISAHGGREKQLRRLQMFKDIMSDVHLTDEEEKPKSRLLENGLDLKAFKSDSDGNLTEMPLKDIPKDERANIATQILKDTLVQLSSFVNQGEIPKSSRH